MKLVIIANSSDLFPHDPQARLWGDLFNNEKGDDFMLNIFNKTGRGKGYLNLKKVLQVCKQATFLYIFGGRGTGKTYGGIEHCLNLKNDPDINSEDYLPMIFMRRRGCEIEATFSEGAQDNPFTDIAEDYGLDFYYVPPKKRKPGMLYWGIKEEVEDENGDITYELKPDYDRGLIAYTCSLSTFAGVRGFGGFRKVKTIIYDEFIKEPTVPNMRGEFNALMSMYETVNRNRELPKTDENGDDIPGSEQPPVKLIAFANANDFNNPYFKGYGISTDVEKMVKDKQFVKVWQHRHLGIVNVTDDSPISQKKKHTHLYESIQGTDYYKMAVENKFEEDDSEVIKSEDLRFYYPLVTINTGITVYKKKGKDTHDGKSVQMYYVSGHINPNSPRRFGKSEAEKQRFVQSFGYLWGSYLKSRVIFESGVCLDLFHEMFDFDCT